MEKSKVNTLKANFGPFHKNQPLIAPKKNNKKQVDTASPTVRPTTASPHVQQQKLQSSLNNNYIANPSLLQALARIQSSPPQNISNQAFNLP